MCNSSRKCQRQEIYRLATKQAWLEFSKWKNIPHRTEEELSAELKRRHGGNRKEKSKNTTRVDNTNAPAVSGPTPANMPPEAPPVQGVHQEAQPPPVQPVQDTTEKENRPSRSDNRTPQITVLSIINTKMLGLFIRYGIDIMIDTTIDFESVPMRFVKDLKELEQECSSYLKQAMQEQRREINLAKDMKRILHSHLASATSDVRENFQKKCVGIFREITKLECNSMVDELQKISTKISDIMASARIVMYSLTD